MYKAGAVAFSEGLQTLENTGIMLKALQYLKTIDGTIIQVPGDKTIAPHGLVNEGITSTLMGLPGKPAIAEEICVARDIELLRYTGSRLHITGISTKVSLELIKNARIEGLHLTCSVTPYHVFFCEEDLAGYNTNLKLNPPLRTRKDMMALRAGLNAGEIDCIASHHLPVHADKKDCEFEYASYGMSNLEATYSAVNTIMEEDPGKLAEMMADKPREIFNLPRPSIEIGQEAVLTLFAPGETYTFSEKNILSHAHNNPFLGHTLKGRVLGTVFRQILHLNAHD
ncbi:MAG: dihydroorotase, partial [Ferruginibacter sp.]